MKLVKLTRWQKFKHWLASLQKGPQGIPSEAKGPQGIPSDAIGPQGTPFVVIKGGKVDLKFDAKDTIYNPREFRVDKGPRK